MSTAASTTTATTTPSVPCTTASQAAGVVDRSTCNHVYIPYCSDCRCGDGDIWRLHIACPVRTKALQDSGRKCWATHRQSEAMCVRCGICTKITNDTEAKDIFKKAQWTQGVSKA